MNDCSRKCSVRHKKDMVRIEALEIELKKFREFNNYEATAHALEAAKSHTDFLGRELDSLREKNHKLFTEAAGLHGRVKELEACPECIHWDHAVRVEKELSESQKKLEAAEARAAEGEKAVVAKDGDLAIERGEIERLKGLITFQSKERDESLSQWRDRYELEKSKVAALDRELLNRDKRLVYFDAWKPADSPDIQEAVIAKLNLVSGEGMEADKEKIAALEKERDELKAKL